MELSLSDMGCHMGPWRASSQGNSRLDISTSQRKTIRIDTGCDTSVTNHERAASYTILSTSASNKLDTSRGRGRRFKSESGLVVAAKFSLANTEAITYLMLCMSYSNCHIM